MDSRVHKSLDPAILMAMWERAMSCEVGVAIESTHPQDLRAVLLSARRESGRGDLNDLITFLPAERNEVFICHKSAELPE